MPFTEGLVEDSARRRGVARSDVGDRETGRAARAVVAVHARVVCVQVGHRELVSRARRHLCGWGVESFAAWIPVRSLLLGNLLLTGGCRLLGFFCVFDAIVGVA